MFAPGSSPSDTPCRLRPSRLCSGRPNKQVVASMATALAPNRRNLPIHTLPPHLCRGRLDGRRAPSAKPGRGPRSHALPTWIPRGDPRPRHGHHPAREGILHCSAVPRCASDGPRLSSGAGNTSACARNQAISCSALACITAKEQGVPCKFPVNTGADVWAGSFRRVIQNYAAGYRSSRY